MNKCRRRKQRARYRASLDVGLGRIGIVEMRRMVKRAAMINAPKPTRRMRQAFASFKSASDARFRRMIDVYSLVEPLHVYITPYGFVPFDTKS